MTCNRSVLAVAFILLTALVGADEPAKKTNQAKEDLKRLQGAWRLDEELFFHTAWMDEKRFPHFLEFEENNRIEFKGDKLRYGKKLGREISIVLGTAEGKKTISFRNGDNTPIIGIYELEKGVFRVCAVDPTLGGGKEEDVRLPEKCERTRGGWFVQFGSVKP